MSDIKETIYYKELRAGDIIQEGDEWWPKDGTGQWQAYHQGMFGLQVLDASIARRPIRATHQTTFEEVPGSRTLQQAVEQPQRERWAYEELQPNDLVQDGDQWQNSGGRWQAIVLTPEASMEVGEALRVRRPYRVSTILEIGDALADAQQAATQLQDERDELKAALRECGAAHKVTMEQRLVACSERDEACKQRDEARAEVERLSATLKSAQRARDELQLQVDELRAGLMGVVSAEHVHSMLEDMLDQTEWVGQCLDSSTYEQMSCIQRTISVIAERVRDIGKEGTSADT